VISGGISGETSVCVGQSFTYSIPAVSGDVSYVWTVPTTGWNIISSQSNSRIITVMPNMLGGTVSVTVIDNLTGCTSEPVTLDVIVMPYSETGPIYRLPNYR
jgi:hypothetical protein